MPPELAPVVGEDGGLSALAKEGRPHIYLCQLHEHDRALTLREQLLSHNNNGWLCWDHGALDLKLASARGLTRHLVSEIRKAGGDFSALPGYLPAINAQSHCHAGFGFEGGAPFGSVPEAVRYLKRYFTVLAHPGNRGLRGHPDCTQVWVDGL